MSTTQRPALSIFLTLASFSALAALATGAIGCDQAAEDQAGLELLQQFSNSCVTKGKWTDQALAQNKALRSVFDAIKELDACKPFATQLATIQSLSDSVSKATEDTSFVDYLRSKSEIADLVGISHLLDKPAGGTGMSKDAQDTLLQSGFNKTATLRKTRAEFDQESGKMKGELFRESSRKFVTDIQGMMADINGLQKCFQQSPLASAQLGVQLLAVAGNSSDSSVSAAAIGSVAQLFSWALSFQSATARAERAKYQLDKAVLAKGLTCALESMTELYCNAADAQELINFRAQAPRKRVGQDGQMIEPIWEGMNLLSRRLPMMTRNLLVIRNGSKVNDTFDAMRQNGAWKKVYELQGTYTEAVGVLNEYEGQHTAAIDARQKEQFVLQALTSLVMVMKTSDPFSENVSNNVERLACMLTVDTEGKGCPPIPPQIHLDNYIRDNHLMEYSFEQIRANFEVLFLRATRAVNIELTRKVIVDPQAMVASLREREGGVGTVSFYEALVELDHFLDSADKYRKTDREKLDTNREYVNLIRDTKRRVREVIELLNPDARCLGELDSASKYQTILGQIFSSFELRLNTQFLPGRIKKIAEWDFNRHLRAGDLPGDAAAILIQMQGELTEDLGADGKPLQPASIDLSTAKVMTQSNIKVFLDFFASSGTFTNAFQVAAEHLRDQADRIGEPMTGPGDRDNRQMLAELCILTASAYDGTNSDKPQAILGAHTDQVLNACKGAVLQSVYLKHSPDQPVPEGQKVAGLPMSLAYDDLFSLFNGEKAKEESKGLDLSELVCKADGKSSATPPDPTDTDAEIFRRAVFNRPAKEEMKFPRKVCTIHRFLRAARIYEALPAIDSEYTENLNAFRK